MKCCRRRAVLSTPRRCCRWTARWPWSPAHRAALDVRSPSRTRRRGRTWRVRAGPGGAGGGARRRVWGWGWVGEKGGGPPPPRGAPPRLSRTEKLDRLLAVDLRGTVLASWKAVELMDAHPPATGGVILNMSWDHVLGGGLKSEYAQVFCAAKGGVYSFSRALAHSVAPRIRVNVLGPGWIETAYGSALDPAVKQRIAAKIPLGRWGTPEDIAHAAVYLASDAAAYVTGQMLMINGGGVV